MNYNEFLALVQERGNRASRTGAGAITRATLETLAERVQGDSEAGRDMAPEIAPADRRR